MCGIVGIASNQDCIQNIISGLKALEYRGYDSSGIAIADKYTLSFQKSAGKLSALENKLDLHKPSEAPITIEKIFFIAAHTSTPTTSFDVKTW